MADYNYYIPNDRPVNFMIGTVDAPGNGSTIPTYTITAGNTDGYYKIGVDNGVLELADTDYILGTYPMILTVSRTDDAGTVDYTVEIDTSAMFSNIFPLIYVDPSKGSNINSGGMLEPLSSIDLAYSRLGVGGVILLETGNYGDRVFNGKAAKIQGLAGSTPLFDSIATDGQTLNLAEIGIEGGGINATGTEKSGVLTLQRCSLISEHPVVVNNYAAVSLLQNVILGNTVAINLSDINEATLSSNVVYGTGVGLVTASIEDLEIQHNTVDGFTSVTLADTVIDGHVRLDSNSITNIGTLTIPTIDEITVRYNNFYNTSVVGVTPDVTNIAGAPLYTNALLGDFSLQDTSPNRKIANPLVATSSTATNDPDLFRNTLAGIGRNKDLMGASRAFKGEISDIGAIENLSDVNERLEDILNLADGGLDIVYNGDVARPLRRLSRALGDSSGDDIKIVQGEVGVSSNRALVTDDTSWELTEALISTSNPQVQQTEEEIAEVGVIPKMDSLVVQPFNTKTYEGERAYVAKSGSDTEGDGTEGKPYRTIDYALGTTAEVVMVFAGGYSDFTGVAGKKLVFLPVDDYVLIGGFSLTDFRDDLWDVQDPGGISTVNYVPNGLVVEQEAAALEVAPDFLTISSAFSVENIVTTHGEQTNSTGITVSFVLLPEIATPYFTISLENARNKLVFQCNPAELRCSVSTSDAGTSGWQGQSRHLDSVSITEPITVAMKVLDTSAQVQVSYGGQVQIATYELIEDTSEPFRNTKGWVVNIGCSPVSSPSKLILSNFSILADGCPYNQFTTEYFTLNASQVSAKYVEIQVPGVDNVALNITQGTSQIRGIDYELFGVKLTWDGYGLDSENMVVGTTLRVIYRVGSIGDPYFYEYHKRALGIITNKPDMSYREELPEDGTI